MDWTWMILDDLEFGIVDVHSLCLASKYTKLAYGLVYNQRNQFSSCPITYCFSHKLLVVFNLP